MEELAFEGKLNGSNIYVLLRVYNIENEGIGMKVYVDPWRSIGRMRKKDLALEDGITLYPSQLTSRVLYDV